MTKKQSELEKWSVESPTSFRIRDGLHIVDVEELKKDGALWLLSKAEEYVRTTGEYSKHQMELVNYLKQLCEGEK